MRNYRIQSNPNITNSDRVNYICFIANTQSFFVVMHVNVFCIANQTLDIYQTLCARNRLSSARQCASAPTAPAAPAVPTGAAALPDRASVKRRSGNNPHLLFVCVYVQPLKQTRAAPDLSRFQKVSREFSEKPEFMVA